MPWYTRRMDDQHSNFVRQTEETIPQQVAAIAPKKGMPLGWKILFCVLLSAVAFATLTFVINPWELMGDPPEQSQWWFLVWLLAIAPIGVVALIALLIATPIYFAKRHRSATQPSQPVSTVPTSSQATASTNQVDRWNWRLLFGVFGGLSIGLPLLSTAAGYMAENSEDGFAAVLLLTLVTGAVSSLTGLVFLILLIMYIVKTTRPKQRKMVAGIVAAAFVLVPVLAVGVGFLDL